MRTGSALGMRLALCVLALSGCTSTDGLASIGHEITRATPLLHDDGSALDLSGIRGAAEYVEIVW